DPGGVDREQGLPVLVGAVECGAGAQHSGRVYHHVHRAEVLFHRVGEVVDPYGVGDVADVAAAAVSTAGQAGCCPGGLCGVDVDRGDRGSATGQGCGDGASDAAARAGDHGDRSCDPGVGHVSP